MNSNKEFKFSKIKNISKKTAKLLSICLDNNKYHINILNYFFNFKKIAYKIIILIYNLKSFDIFIFAIYSKI